MPTQGQIYGIPKGTHREHGQWVVSVSIYKLRHHYIFDNTFAKIEGLDHYQHRFYGDNGIISRRECEHTRPSSPPRPPSAANPRCEYGATDSRTRRPAAPRPYKNAPRSQRWPRPNAHRAARPKPRRAPKTPPEPARTPLEPRVPPTSGASWENLPRASSRV